MATVTKKSEEQQPQPASTSTPLAAATNASNEIANLVKGEQQKGGELVQLGFNTWQGFQALKRVGEYIASMSLIPDTYKDKPANCSMALNISMRLGVDLLMVMQNLFFVHGKPGWSAQFAIASFNSKRRYSSIRYKWYGAEGSDDWGCEAYAVETATGETLTGPKITIKLAKSEGWYDKNGSKWKSMPQLMLCYRAATWFIRVTAPEILMGFHTEDELKDIGEAEFSVVSATSIVPNDTASRLLSAAGGTETVDEKTGELSFQ